MRTGLPFALLCAFFLVIPGLIAPAFTRIFIDDYLIGTEKDWLRPLLLGMVITIVVQMALTALQQWCLLRFRTKLSLASSGRFLAHVLRLPMRYFSQRFSGEIGSRLALNDQVAEMVGGELATIALNFVLVAFFGVLLYLYDPMLATVAVVLALLNFIALKLVSRARTDRNRVLMQEYGKLYGTSINGLAMIENLKCGGGEDDFFFALVRLSSPRLDGEAVAPDAVPIYRDGTEHPGCALGGIRPDLGSISDHGRAVDGGNADCVSGIGGAVQCPADFAD